VRIAKFTCHFRDQLHGLLTTINQGLSSDLSRRGTLSGQCRIHPQAGPQDLDTGIKKVVINRQRRDGELPWCERWPYRSAVTWCNARPPIFFL